MLVDGLGHGRDAAEAAEEAVAVFRKRVDRPSRLRSCPISMSIEEDSWRGGRDCGDPSGQKTLTYAGVGNIAAVLLSERSSRSLVSHNGTLGVATPKIQEFQVEWPDDGILIMHSDGLQSRWDLSSYSGLLARHAAVIGAALFRDFRRQRDDASVVVVKAACNSMSSAILNIALRTERDVVQARQRARELAAALGFDNQDQIRLATATSEMARNAFRYARDGKVAFSVILESAASGWRS